jgi:hypothetical protein
MWYSNQLNGGGSASCSASSNPHEPRIYKKAKRTVLALGHISPAPSPFAELVWLGGNHFGKYGCLAI